MKKKLLLLPAILLCAIALIVVSTNDFSSTKKRADYEQFIISNGQKFTEQIDTDIKNPGPDRPDEAAFSEFVKTVDPDLQRVPAERRFDAIQETQEIVRMKNGASGLNWNSHRVEFGGRTRTIMFDPNDPTGMGIFAGSVSGGLWYNTNPLEGNDWSPINDYWPNLAVSCMTYDPQDTQTMFVGTGESQTALVIYRESSTRGTGIMKSTDGGEMWELIPSTKDWAYVTDIIIRIEEGVSVIYAGVVSGIYHGTHQSNPSDGLYRSVDGGDSWTQVLPLIPGMEMPYAPSDISMSSDKSRLFVGSTYGINSTGTDIDRTGAACLLYSDDGVNWTVNRTYNDAILENEINKYPGRVMIANSESDSDITYAIIASGYPAGPFLGYGCEYLLKSTDKGETWTDINFPQGFASLAWHAFVIEVNPEDPDIIWLGGLDVWRTLDGGDNWSHLTNWAEGMNTGTGRYVHADIHSFLHHPNNSRQMYVATDGGVFFTGSSLSPDNVTFHEMNENYNTLQFYTCDISPLEGVNQFIGGLQDNGTVLYQPGITPNRGTKLGGGDGAYCFIDENDPGLTITSHYYTNMHISKIDPVDPPQYFGSFLAGVGTFINPMDYDWKTNTLYCNVCSFNGTDANILGVLTIENNQMAGQPLELATDCAVPYSVIKWDRNSTEEVSSVYIGTASGRLFKLTDAVDPSTLSEITGSQFPTANLGSIDIGQSPDTLMVTFTNYGVNSVWLSTDAGDNWSNIESNLPDMPIRWGIFHPESSSHIMLATETGVWTTNNSLSPEVTWSPDIEGMANVRVDMLQMRHQDNTVLAATHGRGLFTTEWKLGNTSGVDVTTIENDLSVYPNPTNGEFNIDLDLMDEANLTILDSQGRKVHQELIQAGTQSLRYNLGNEPKGLYFIRIEGEKLNQTGKILIK